MHVCPRHQVCRAQGKQGHAPGTGDSPRLRAAAPDPRHT